MKDTLKKFGVKVALDVAYTCVSLITSYATKRAIEYINEQRIKRHYLTIEVKD